MTGRNMTTAVLAASVLAACLGGCGGSNYQNYDEVFIRAGITDPRVEDVPDWVLDSPEHTPDELFFVGRGVGYNVLDERAAYDAARDHAIQQMARHIASCVVTRTREQDRRPGTPSRALWSRRPLTDSACRFLPGERVRQDVDAITKVTTAALAGDLEERGIYWEQWGMTEVPERAIPSRVNRLRMKRYKCWLLMAVPRAKLDSRIAATFSSVGRTGRNFGVVGDHAGAPGPKARIDPSGAAAMLGCPCPARKEPEIKSVLHGTLKVLFAMPEKRQVPKAKVTDLTGDRRDRPGLRSLLHGTLATCGFVSRALFEMP